MTAASSNGASANGDFEALLRAGFPYEKTLGRRAVTFSPIDLAIGDDGRVYFLGRGPFDTGGSLNVISDEDEDLGVVRRRDPIATDRPMDCGWTWPVGIILDPEGRLIVSDEADHTITIVTPESEPVAEWGEHGSEPGQLNRPAHMALDDQGHLLVVDSLNHRVQRFSLEGEYIDGFGTYGSAPGEFDMPWGIAVDTEGCIYIGDWRNDRVQKLSPAGEPLMVIGSSGDAEGELNRPAGVAVDQHGDIYVADRGNNRVMLFNRDGRYVERFFGDATVSKSGLRYLLENSLPLRLRDMAMLEDQKHFMAPASVRLVGDRMYVGDFGYNRVQIYRKEAYPLTADQIMPHPGKPTLATT
jgi:sugar lactone lactonase YvrE